MIFILVNEIMDGVDFDDGMCSDEINICWNIMFFDGGVFNFEYGNFLVDFIEV